MSAAVRAGFKQTEVGVIPEDWEVKQLKSLNFDISDGNYSSKYPKASDFKPIGVSFIRANNVRNMTVSDEDMRYITVSQHRELQKGHLKAGDVLITTRGDIGQIALVPDAHIGSNINAQIVRINTTSQGTFFRYFAYAMISKGSQEQIEMLQTGSALKQLPVGKLTQLWIALPSLAEQRAIATALSDVDALLSKLDALIAKKRDLKQAAMQQLLTGQTRLPGFTGEWEVKRLGDVGRFLKGSGVKKDESLSGDLRCIRYGEIYTRHSDYIKQFHSWISPQVAQTAVRLKTGDLCFAGSGETKEDIGKCVAFVDEVEAYAGGDIVILRLDNSNAIFFGYYLNTTPINTQKASNGQGDAVVHISATALSTVQISIPTFEEQSAIATVLSDMDAELTALEARRDKTRALKQGMMQELLTGRIRLV